MPIEVTPVNQVDIDLTNASKGDTIRLNLQEDEPLFLTAVKNRTNHELRLSIKAELVPLPLYEHLVEKALKILKRNGYEINRWWKEQAEQKHHGDMFSELLDAIITSRPYVTNVQHGEHPVLQFKAPFSLSWPDAQELYWKAPSSVVRITAVEADQVERQIGIYQGERELHALRVR